MNLIIYYLSLFIFIKIFYIFLNIIFKYFTINNFINKSILTVYKKNPNKNFYIS